MNEKTKIGLSDETRNSCGKKNDIWGEVESILNPKERDKSDKWCEVMTLAEKYGFIRFAYAGFAMLSIDKEAMKVK